MQTAKKIIIVGGGIGGAATALALHQADFEPVVYERTKELKEVGAGIALWANATHVLKNLGLLSDAIRVGYLTTNYQFNSQSGKELVNVPLDNFDLPVVGIHRAELHQLLYLDTPTPRRRGILRRFRFLYPLRVPRHTLFIPKDRVLFPKNLVNSSNGRQLSPSPGVGF